MNSVYFQDVKTSGGYLLLDEMKKVECIKFNLKLSDLM